MSSVSKRFVGTCPVCLGTFKVTQKHRRSLHADGKPVESRMVLHGYLRPGQGYLIGDCFGVGHFAYEISSEGSIAYKAAVQGQKRMAEALLEKLRSGEAESAWYVRRKGGQRERVEVKRGEERFLEALQQYTMMTDTEIRACDREIVRITAVIEAWTAKELRTVDELEKVADIEKTARAAERLAKHEAAVAKAKARKELLIKREEERKAMITEYCDLFLRLAASPENVNSKRYTAVQTWAKMYRLMRKKVYLQFHPRELVCDLALRSLGLADFRGSHLIYADHQGVVQ